MEARCRNRYATDTCADTHVRRLARLNLPISTSGTTAISSDYVCAIIKPSALKKGIHYFAIQAVEGKSSVMIKATRTSEATGKKIRQTHVLTIIAMVAELSQHQCSLRSLL